MGGKFTRRRRRADAVPFRTIAQISPLPTIVTSFSAGRILWANDAFCGAIGRESAQLVGADVRSFYAAAGSHDRLCAMLSETGEVRNLAVEGKRPDGVTVQLLMGARRLEFEGQNAIIMSAADITEQQHALQALRHSEERLTAIADLAPFPVGVTRLADAKLTYVNRAFAEFMQSTQEALLGRVAPDFYANPDDRAVMLAQLREHGKLMDYDILARRPDGEERRVQVSLQILTFDGQPSIMASVADVTEFYAAQAALSEERQRLAGMVDIASEAIVSVDAQYKLLLYNRGAEDIFGYTSKEVLGKPLDILIPEAARTPHRAHMAAFANESDTRRRMGLRREVEGRRKNGESFPASVSISKLPIRGGLMFTAIVRDLSEAKAAEQALAHSREQLLQAQKMEALGRLAGGVAHDFNNLLTAVYLHCGALRNKLPADAPGLADVDEIQRAGLRAAELTSRLLALSRKQTLHRAVVDLNETMSSLETTLRRLIGENIELRSQLHADPLPVEVDTGQLEQVMLNLVINAADAVDMHGMVTIRTAQREHAEPRLGSHGVIPPGVWATFEVHDDGSGIDEATMPRIFEPFYTTKNIGAGTGLGLSTVHGIVDQSAGVIEVTSEAGHGTTFRVWLPVHDGKPDQPQPAQQAPVGLGGAERILLVEDDHRLREATAQVLRDLGYEVLAAADGEAAVRICTEMDGPLQLVLSDVVMPGLNGRELADQLGTMRPEARVLFMTGYAADHLADRGFLAEGTQIIDKPFRPDELAARVRQVLDA